MILLQDNSYSPCFLDDLCMIFYQQINFPPRWRGQILLALAGSLCKDHFSFNSQYSDPFLCFLMNAHFNFILSHFCRN